MSGPQKVVAFTLGLVVVGATVFVVLGIGNALIENHSDNRWFAAGAKALRGPNG